MFVDSKYDNLDMYFREVQSDITQLFLSVHDELDVTVMSADGVHKPMLKKLTEIGAIKKIVDQLPLPYVNFLFDVEWGDDGSWLPTTQMEAFTYAKTPKEAELRDKYLEYIKSNNTSNKKEGSNKYYTLNLSGLGEDLVEKKIQEILKLPKGDTTVIIKYNGESWELDYKVKLS